LRAVQQSPAGESGRSQSRPAQHRAWHRESGAALVEYAFVALFFLSLLFGISAFGHALYIYHALNNAAKEGTRWAAVNGYTCSDDNSCNGVNGMNTNPATRGQINAYVVAHFPPSVDSAKARVISDFVHPAGSPPVCTGQVKTTTGATVGPIENYPGCTVQVTVSYAYNFNFPLVANTTQITPPCLQAGYCLSSTSELVIIH
jgi:Flp pilus assembly protein TadG